MAPLVLRTPRRKTLGLALLCLVLTAASVVALLDGGLIALVGALGVVFFGVGGGYAVSKQLRRHPVLTLTAEGVRPGTGGLVPWPDVAAFGVTRIGSVRAVGLALRDPANFLRSLTPDQIRLTMAVGAGARAVGPLLAAADPAGSGDAARLAGIPHRDLEGMLAWSRTQTGGYDLAWSSSLFDGRPEQVVAECEAYRRRALGST